ncbi:bombyxin F-1-like [Aphis gossypii]|uniref:bombyxin F-1-like n=1 Tax=Aphis gossypii TaxID=80765 RepID=UPI00100F4BE7|nr:bombyxin F-1-like [Aphis gossypii]
MKLYIIITTLSFLCIESGIQFAVGSPLSENYMNGLNQFCGQALANELAILCKGRYNDPKGKKGRRGIVDECCSQPCTRSYMKINYCQPETEAPIWDSPMLGPQKKVDYLGYYFQLIGQVLGLTEFE